MSAKPLVSVIIPTYNYGRFVTEAVESVLAQVLPDGQAYTDYEIIVVDDGSTDDTRERLAPYLDRIRYIYQENRGLSAARNTGIKAARGNFIAFLDSDDLWLPEKLAVQAPVLERDPEVGLLGCAAVGYDEAHQRQASREISAEELVVSARFGPGSVVARRECFETCGLFDEELRSAEDRDMWIRIARRWRIVKLSQPLWEYRIHTGSMSFNIEKMKENQVRLLRKTFAYPEFRRRPCLRLQAWSRLYYDVGYSYSRMEARRLRSIANILLSMLLWPGPFGRPIYNTSFIRTRTVLYSILGRRLFRGIKRLMGGTSSAPATVSDNSEVTP